MIVSFHTEELQHICCRFDAAEAALGRAHANALTTTLADIEAMATAAEIFELWDGDVELQGNDSLSLAVGSVYVATFIPVGAKVASDAHGKVDWQSVTRLKILTLEKRQ